MFLRNFSNDVNNMQDITSQIAVNITIRIVKLAPWIQWRGHGLYMWKVVGCPVYQGMFVEDSEF